jgi:hypothetical protein
MSRLSARPEFQGGSFCLRTIPCHKGQFSVSNQLSLSVHKSLGSALSPSSSAKQHGERLIGNLQSRRRLPHCLQIQTPTPWTAAGRTNDLAFREVIRSGRASPHRNSAGRTSIPNKSIFDAVRRVSIRCCGRDKALMTGARDVVFERESNRSGRSALRFADARTAVGPLPGPEGDRSGRAARCHRLVPRRNTRDSLESQPQVRRAHRDLDGPR